MFSDLVWAHWCWERQRHLGDIAPHVEREYRRCRSAFQSRFGEITDTYWSIRDASGVALTVARTRSGLLPFTEVMPRFHVSFDWATREEPAIAEVLNECGALAIRAGEVLRGSSELIALRRIVSVASHLLGFVDRAHGRPAETDALAVADRQPGNGAAETRPPSGGRSPAQRRHAQVAAYFATEQRKELARIEVFLRIPSPSRLWPKHSCASTPPQPGAITTGYVPALGSTAEFTLQFPQSCFTGTGADGT